LTTVLAGLAFTTTSLPNIVFLDAFVAGFLRVLILGGSDGTDRAPTLPAGTTSAQSRGCC